MGSVRFRESRGREEELRVGGVVVPGETQLREIGRAHV